MAFLKVLNIVAQNPRAKTAVETMYELSNSRAENSGLDIKVVKIVDGHYQMAREGAMACGVDITGLPKNLIGGMYR